MSTTATTTTTAIAQPQTISLPSLPVSQLRALKSQLDTELEHLTTSHQKLRAAQDKFRDCIKSVEEGLQGAKNDIVAGADGGKMVLVPLTGSLYVPGRLVEEGGLVLVDVGTGFYVEKTRGDAVGFYREKVDGIEANLKDLEKIVQGKSGNVRVVEEVLRQKMLSSKNNSTPTS